MRVLDTRTSHFVEIDPKKEKYAILSHTWDRKGEQTYQELREIQKKYSQEPQSPRNMRYDSRSVLASAAEHQSESLPTLTSGFDYADSSDDDDDNDDNSSTPLSSQPLSAIWEDPALSCKIREACRVAREHGYRYIWIDSCCIDKASSSELSESINSMYQWYARAHVCYAFLARVRADEDHRRQGSRFRRSRWFTRGWTLQELIAPIDVQFLSKEWTLIGSKHSLADLVVEITEIKYNALLHIESLDEFSVAQRLSWAASRQTTREEDRAYSLLGLFDINMPTLYGEGERAFRRLQEEIMRRTPDQSLFAWTTFAMPDPSSQVLNSDATDSDKQNIRFLLWEGPPGSIPFLASSLNVFRHCTDIDALPHDEVARRLQLHPSDLPAGQYDFTPYGIRMLLPTISFSDYLPPGRVETEPGIPLSQWYLVILGCEHKAFPGHLLGRVCRRSSGSSVEFLHSGWAFLGDKTFGSELLPLFPDSPVSIARLDSSRISVRSLYIPQPARDRAADDLACEKRHETIKLVLPRKTREALSAQGYTATLRSLDDARPGTHSVTLSHDTHTIRIDYQHTLEERDMGGQRMAIEADVKVSGAVPSLQDTPGDLRLGLPQADGLRTRVSWQDFMTWEKELDFKDVKLDVADSPVALTVRLGLTLATMNHYFLLIELKTADPPPANAEVKERPCMLDGQETS